MCVRRRVFKRVYKKTKNLFFSIKLENKIVHAEEYID